MLWPLSDLAQRDPGEMAAPAPLLLHAAQDRAAFMRLIGVSVLQSAASAVLAPSLKHTSESLALAWRRRLTRIAHAQYLRGNTFYSASQLAGMQVRRPGLSCPSAMLLNT